jgi:hypothetical protein
MEGEFAGERLQSIDEDDDMLSAMARELVERNGIRDTVDSVWRAISTEHQKLFPTTCSALAGSQAESPDLENLGRLVDAPTPLPPRFRLRRVSRERIAQMSH